MTPHPHAEIIKAWADGHPIQFRSAPDRPWNDIKKDCAPAFMAHLEYRVQPPTRLATQEYHVYLREGAYVPTFTTEYPSNLRLTFEAGKLIDAQALDYG